MSAAARGSGWPRRRRASTSSSPSTASRSGSSSRPWPPPPAWRAPTSASGCSTTATPTRCARSPSATARATCGARTAAAPRRATSTTRSRARTPPYVLVLDCDHVPARHFLEATLGHLADERVAFVQTPQYYANAGRGEVPAAAWSQQALFFGPIARGKDGHEAMFCCGTNVLFRRAALLDVGGFPADVDHRGLRAVDPAARARLALALRRRGARRRARAGGHDLLRRPAAALVARLPRRAARRAAVVAAAAAQGAVRAVGVLLPLGLDRARLHGVPGRAHRHRRPAARGHDRGPVPRALRAVLRHGRCWR